MSDKTISERLREWADGAGFEKTHLYPTGAAAKDLGIVRQTHVDTEVEVFRAIADEIDAEKKALIDAQRDSAHHIMRLWAEKNGMPMLEKGETIKKWLDRWFVKRPRFEDGEPVQWYDGKNIEWDEESSLMINAIGKDGVPLALGVSSICARALMTGDGRVRRRKTNALDANGVPYERGQKVWRISDGEWFYVDEVKPNGKLDLKQGGLGEMVFNAEPFDFTHHEPDSYEKLRDDIEGFKTKGAYHGAIDAFLQRCESRLTALIERGA